MSGKIFVLDGSGQFAELSQEKYASEAHLQELIEKHPAILAGDQISSDNPIRWILVSREMGVPGSEDGGSQWYLDHLFIDHDGIPTFVEVKRSENTDIRRKVVGQMMDYVANAVIYWPIDLIRNCYEQSLTEENTMSLADIGVPPDREAYFWQTVQTNLKAGRVRLIFAADSIPLSLQRIIEFLNGQMSDAEVLGLEVKQFLSTGGITTLVPSIIGKEEKLPDEGRVSQTLQGVEADALVIIKSILSSVVEPDRVTYTKGKYIYFSLDGNDNKRVCWLFVGQKNWLVLPGEDEMKYRNKKVWKELSSVDEIHTYKDDIIAAAKRIMEGSKMKTITLEEYEKQVSSLAFDVIASGEVVRVDCGEAGAFVISRVV
jgi:hypothetical protein